MSTKPGRKRQPVGDGRGTDTQTRVARFLRALAAQAEQDPTLAAHLARAMRDSGLLTMPSTTDISAADMPAYANAVTPRGSGQSDGEASRPDPYALYRQGGEAGLRAALGQLDVAALREMLRRHHLDPARTAARWTNTTRIVDLIVDQVRARATRGSAFARV